MDRQMRNPESWIGRKVKHLNWNRFWNYNTCDDCQCFYRIDDLHALLWPETEADWTLQEALSVEEAMGFCPACLSQIEVEADKIDPEWRKRHMLA